MPDLSRDLRRALETTIKAARDAAEAGAADALRGLGVFDSRRPGHLDDARNETRKRLRAHAKSLGDHLNAADGEPLRRLVEAAAYVQWHRLLFARFLVERGLLRDATGVAVSLADCAEEAAMDGNGDEWSFAAGYTARMLPGVFPADDPAEALTLAPENAKALRSMLLKMDAAIFKADDSLGWTYQFWRAGEKKRVNDSGVKIGAAELPAVTQLFTEPYMVRFLLHNTLGAWWAGKVLVARPDLARDAPNETELRAACALPAYAWDFLRFVKEDETWRPAAGVFPGWPVKAAALTVLDPCCGSGHFLTEALAALAALRAAEEKLGPAAAVVAVLRDNLAGLEIDGRCVQIAAFALAVTAWRVGGAGVSLPTPHVAWVGGPPPMPKGEFAALANGDTELRRGLEALHDLFTPAPLLGSLIEPVGGDLIDPSRVARIEESVAALISKMRSAEPDRAEGVLAARGMADATAILARRWILQLTNVPFCGSRKHGQELKRWLTDRFEIAKADLAAAMVLRLTQLAAPHGTVAAVTKQETFFQDSYIDFRRKLLSEQSLCWVVGLGSRAFETIGGEVVNGALIVLNQTRSISSSYRAWDLNSIKQIPEKIEILLSKEPNYLSQVEQLRDADCRIRLVPQEAQNSQLLSRYCETYQGIKTGDDYRYVRFAFEVLNERSGWLRMQSTVEADRLYGGLERVVWWGNDGLHLIRRREEGQAAVAKYEGVAVSQMGDLGAAIMSSPSFDSNISPILVKDKNYLPAVYSFCSSQSYKQSIKHLEPSIKANNGAFLKVPFDLVQWQQVAAEKYPNGLPEPYSDDPTQWLFHGHPRQADAGTELHVALARLSGYRWPAETDPGMRLSAEARARIAEAATLPPADADGLLVLVPALGERPLADRLRAFCVTAWGDAWTTDAEAALVAAACEKAKDKPPGSLTLDAWLRTHAARQHAKLFHDRPFLWWITDGRADGFTAVAHYHRLTKGNLERLTYTVLGDWITRLGTDPKSEAARVLQSKLARILEGEAPYDIFVRWKPLHIQPLGWDPDLDDGVRLNIRPFIEAGVLAHVPNGIHYRTDRGKDVSSSPWFPVFNGNRRNDHHTTLQEKQAERAKFFADQQHSGDWPIQVSAPAIDPANAAAILRPMIRALLETGDGGTGTWLKTRAALVRQALDPTGGPTGPEARAASMFLQWLGPRLLTAERLPESLRPLDAVSPLPLARAEALYAALRIAAEVSGTDPGSMVTAVGNRLELLPPERRVALGTTNRDGQQQPLLLFTEPNDRALKQADADGVPAKVVGQAVSQSDTLASPTVPLDEHRPGRSVAHEAGRAGSLGAYVNWDDAGTGRRLTGFVSAGHVIARMGKASLGDHIHSPGSPDADNNIRYRYGLLQDARRLIHVDDIMASDAYLNECDIALARLLINRPATNTVPGLESSDPPVMIARVMTESELRAFSGEVLMIGRTTPHARGRYYGYEIKQIVIQMPNRLDYIFANVVAVESMNPQSPFSQPGDSGALVYAFVAGEWAAVGFIIGAVGQVTYISPAEGCLRTMQVQLLGA